MANENHGDYDPYRINTFDPEGSPLNDTPAQYEARRAAQIAKSNRDAENAARARRGEAPLRDPNAPRYSAEDIELVAARAAEQRLKEAYYKANPLAVLPEAIRSKHAMTMSPAEYYDGLKALGAPVPSWDTIEREQQAWARAGGGRG